MGELIGKSQNVRTFCFVDSWISLAKVNKMHFFLMLLCINLSLWGSSCTQTKCFRWPLCCHHELITVMDYVRKKKMYDNYTCWRQMHEKTAC